jgi:hypothetical protein
MSRRATRFNKRDSNEIELVKTMKDLGLPWIESGPLDGWTVLGGRFVPVEFKAGKNKLTKGQEEFTDLCDHHGWPYAIFRTTDEIVNAVTRIGMAYPTKP